MLPPDLGALGAPLSISDVHARGVDSKEGGGNCPNPYTLEM